MSSSESRVNYERQLIQEAQAKGSLATLKAYIRLSGPGWLQSAITLGGGSLAGALFLGILGGTSLLWLQLVAIVMGVVMLSAISYVTLSTGERPFRAINQHVNPALGWGWIIATMLANMIWCMPQFSLCYAALQKNLLPKDSIPDTDAWKYGVSAILLLAALFAVTLNARQGVAARVFDWFLKALVGIVVICFVGVVVLLTINGALNWPEILAGFVPDLRQWSSPTGTIGRLIEALEPSYQEFWSARVVKAQRDVMIGAAATAVGINMTFLMPYSLLKRGWDRTFRGLARFDLATGMAIPYVLVTSCVVIAAAARFHAQVDDAFLSTDPEEMQTSSLFKGAREILEERVRLDDPEKEWTDEELLQAMASLSPEEKTVASSLVQRDAFELASALAPLLGSEQRSRIFFGLGIFGMGFSSIIILMLINGFAVCELANVELGGWTHVVGCLIAGLVGAIWPSFWAGDSKVYLAIIASSFGMMLLPIAYITFFLMMNSRSLMKDDLPRGGSRVVWNVLMLISIAGALAAATSAILAKLNDEVAGPVVKGLLVAFGIAVVVGFFKKPSHTDSASGAQSD